MSLMSDLEPYLAAMEKRFADLTAERDDLAARLVAATTALAVAPVADAPAHVAALVDRIEAMGTTEQVQKTMLLEQVTFTR